tara:strand:+ start:238581 stop:238703 length:123 start_codon:yes stop_codon:yes gene_type:complete
MLGALHLIVLFVELSNFLTSFLQATLVMKHVQPDLPALFL